MIWKIFLSISIAVLTVALVFFVYQRYVKHKKLTSALRILFFGMYAAVFLLVLPIYYHELDFSGNRALHVIKTLMMSLNKSAKAFAIAELPFMSRNPGLGDDLYAVYSGYLTALLFVCPLLSLSYIMAFFSKLRSNAEYLISYGRELYVFTALTEDSLALAKDLAANHPKSKIVFCEVTPKIRGEQTVLIQGAEQISAICFHKDVKSINFNKHKKGKLICFFNIKPDEQSNTADALVMLARYKKRENTELYIFSTLNESRLVLANADSGRIKVRRVDKVQTFITRYLYDHGEELFQNALPAADGDKQISAVILGLGRLPRQDRHL